jgi:hypothetical protein
LDCRRIPEYERAVVLGSTLDMVRKGIVPRIATTIPFEI